MCGASRVVAHELEGEVALDGAGEVGLAAGVHVPAAVGLLELAEVVGDQRQVRVVLLAEDELHQDVFGFEDAVALKLADPVARPRAGACSSARLARSDRLESTRIAEAAHGGPVRWAAIRSNRC